MPRAAVEDFFQGFRFQVRDTEGFLQPEGGFQTCTAPELTLGEAPYRDGIQKFTKKQPGIPSFNNLTLEKGVVKNDTKFFEWIKKFLDGEPFRTDVEIRHFHPSDPASPESQPSRIYRLFDVVCLRVKFAGDFDANDDSISIESLDMAYEESDIEDVEATA